MKDCLTRKIALRGIIQNSQNPRCGLPLCEDSAEVIEGDMPFAPDGYYNFGSVRDFNHVYKVDNNDLFYQSALDEWRSALAKYTKSYSHTEYTDTFYYKQNAIDLFVHYSCGYCFFCRQKKLNEWQTRINYEILDNPANYVMVFTYKDKFLPKNGLLQFDDIQKLFKRMRKHGFKFRYFGCGEYGETKGRPHYHVLFFASWALHDVRLDEYKVNGYHIYRSAFIEKIWGKGKVWIQFADKSPKLSAYLGLYFSKNGGFKHYMLKAQAELDKTCSGFKMLPFNYSDNQLDDFKKNMKKTDEELLALKKMQELHKLHREKLFFSKSVGWAAFERKYFKYGLDAVKITYIDGRPHNIPTPWLIKLMNQGFSDATQYYLELTSDFFAGIEKETLDEKRQKAQQKIAQTVLSKKMKGNFEVPY